MPPPKRNTTGFDVVLAHLRHTWHVHHTTGQFHDGLVARSIEILERIQAEEMTASAELSYIRDEIGDALARSEKWDRGGQHVGTGPPLTGAPASVRRWLRRLIATPTFDKK